MKRLVILAVPIIWFMEAMGTFSVWTTQEPSFMVRQVTRFYTYCSGSLFHYINSAWVTRPTRRGTLGIFLRKFLKSVKLLTSNFSWIGLGRVFEVFFSLKWVLLWVYYCLNISTGPYGQTDKQTNREVYHYTMHLKSIFISIKIILSTFRNLPQKSFIA